MELADLDVLIVDDHEAMRALLTRVFTKVGVAKLRAAASANEALTALRARPASLILADKNMPGMDGLAFLAEVRGESAFGAPKIIMLSGDASSAHADAARAAGADAVLVKPVPPSALLAAINELFAV
ncbi:MAG: response regulator [Alphaproteobacteria bacterium]|nr:response regulator [Alphaproteobacteria bacterium]